MVTLGFTGCKSKKSVEKPDQGAVEAPVKKSIERWVVTFDSEGSGPDNQAIRLLERKMVEWQETYRWELFPERIAWGKEGEMDYCFPINQFSDFAPQRLDALFKETFGDNPRVHWAKVPDCPHKPRSQERY